MMLTNTGTNVATYVSGLSASPADQSYSALNSSALFWTKIQFIVPLHGGFDGLDIEKEPFRDGLMSEG